MVATAVYQQIELRTVIPTVPLRWSEDIWLGRYSRSKSKILQKIVIFRMGSG